MNGIMGKKDKKVMHTIGLGVAAVILAILMFVAFTYLA